jgi:hypothetical protein
MTDILAIPMTIDLARRLLPAWSDARLYTLLEKDPSITVGKALDCPGIYPADRVWLGCIALAHYRGRVPVVAVARQFASRASAVAYEAADRRVHDEVAAAYAYAAYAATDVDAAGAACDAARHAARGIARAALLPLPSRELEILLDNDERREQLEILRQAFSAIAPAATEAPAEAS